jgi:putative thioredoxin
MAHEVHDFQKEVLERSRTVPVLVDFWAEWCGPCRVLGPTLERLAASADGRWVLAKLNTEEFPDVAMQYGIRSIPNVKLFIDAKPVNEFVGALPEPAIVEWLKKAIPAKKITEVETAQTLLENLQFEKAQKLLEPVGHPCLLRPGCEDRPQCSARGPGTRALHRCRTKPPEGRL